MTDKVFEYFLRRQFDEGKALAAASDIVRLVPVDGAPPNRYLVAFQCEGLVRWRDGEVRQAREFHAGIYFAPDYLRTVRPGEVVTMLFPDDIWHPNILGPAICLGGIAPGMSIVDLLHQIYEILSYQNWASHDGLNPAACEWARNNQDRFPLERRPLRRRPAARTPQSLGAANA